MSQQPAYVFRTTAQWAEGLRLPLGIDIHLAAENGREVAALAAGGTRAAFIGPGEVFWVDQAGVLHAERVAGPRVGETTRLTCDRVALWTLDAQRVERFDRRTLQRVDVWDAALDIASDGRGGLFRLEKSGDAQRVTHLHRRGAGTELEGIVPRDALGLAALTPKRLAILEAEGEYLTYWALDEGPRRMSVKVADALAAYAAVNDGARDWGAFKADRIDTLGPNGVALIGRWEDKKWAGVVLFANDRSVTARAITDGQEDIVLAANSRRIVFETKDEEARRLVELTWNPAGGAVFFTPKLVASDPTLRWLRAEAVVRLPEGAAFEAQYAASDAPSLQHSAQRIFESDSPTAEKIAALLRLFDGGWSRRRTVYAGRRTEPDAEPDRLDIPLFEAQADTLWLMVRTTPGGLAGEAKLESLSVIHSTPSLMSRLPAHFSGSGDTALTLRKLVGVLEASASAIDAQIGGLGEQLDPARTPKRRLGELARLLGLPHHEDLDEEMSRRVVGAAANLLTQRGSRSGMLTLLEALFPRRPVKIVDLLNELMPISLGGGGRAGVSLPSFLSGPSAKVAKLNARLVLGRTGLCEPPRCGGERIRPAPRVIVTIPVTAQERARLSDAIEQMLQEMTPAGLRLVVSYSAWRGLDAAGVDAAEVLSVIPTPEPLRLGEGPQLGLAHLDGDPQPMMSEEGDPIARRLN